MKKTVIILILLMAVRLSAQSVSAEKRLRQLAETEKSNRILGGQVLMATGGLALISGSFVADSNPNKPIIAPLSLGAIAIGALVNQYTLFPLEMEVHRLDGLPESERQKSAETSLKFLSDVGFNNRMVLACGHIVNAVGYSVAQNTGSGPYTVYIGLDALLALTDLLTPSPYEKEYTDYQKDLKTGAKK